jgi:hypothetical protein
MGSFEQDYGIETMTGVVKRFANNSHNRVFTDEFESGDRTILPDGDSFSWDEIRFSRDLASLVPHGEEGARKKRVVVRKRTGGMLDVEVTAELPPEFLFFMRNAGELGGNARAKIDTEIEDGAIQVANTVEFVCQRACTGSVDPATVPNSKLKSDAITFPVHALAKSVAWSDTANSKINSVEVPRIEEEYYKKANVEASRAITTRTVEGYLKQNAELNGLIQANPIIAAEALQQRHGGVRRVGNIDFRFQRSHYALDATPDTTVDYMTSDHVVVLPDEGIRKDTFAMVDGLTAIPAGPVFGDISSAAAAMRLVRGYYAYWELKGKKLILHIGRRFMPVIKMVNGVMLFDSV